MEPREVALWGLTQKLERRRRKAWQHLTRTRNLRLLLRSSMGEVALMSILLVRTLRDVDFPFSTIAGLVSTSLDCSGGWVAQARLSWPAGSGRCTLFSGGPLCLTGRRASFGARPFLWAGESSKHMVSSPRLGLWRLYTNKLPAPPRNSKEWSQLCFCGALNGA